MQVSVCLGAILIPEYLDSHSGYSAPRRRIARIIIFRNIFLFRNIPNERALNQSINWYRHMKDHVEIGHLTKYDASRVNRDQLMDLEIRFKIHTNVSYFEKASPKTIIFY